MLFATRSGPMEFERHWTLGHARTLRTDRLFSVAVLVVEFQEQGRGNGRDMDHPGEFHLQGSGDGLMSGPAWTAASSPPDDDRFVDVHYIRTFSDGARKVLVNEDRMIRGRWLVELMDDGCQRKVTHWRERPESPEGFTQADIDREDLVADREDVEEFKLAASTLMDRMWCLRMSTMAKMRAITGGP